MKIKIPNTRVGFWVFQLPKVRIYIYEDDSNLYFIFGIQLDFLPILTSDDHHFYIIFLHIITTSDPK
jgi:hypothetical protein